MVTPSLFGDDDLTAVYYISYFEITFEDSPTAISSWDPTFDFCYTLNPFIQEYVFSNSPPDPGTDDPDSDNPAFGLIPYTDWIGTALSGFFDAELFPGFTLGGVFMTLFSFSCAIWFLKLVAGG